MPSKRSSVLNKSPERANEDTGIYFILYKLNSMAKVLLNFCCLESSTGDESIPEEVISPDKEYNYPRDHVGNLVEQNIRPPIRESSKGKSSNKNSQLERRQKQALPPLVSEIYTRKIFIFSIKG